MTLTYGFFDSLSGDRVYNAGQFGEMFDGVITDGIFVNIGSAFAVTANGDMTLDIGDGRAWFNGIWIKNDVVMVLELTDADIALDRIDTVVIKVDKRSTERLVSIEIVDGTPASTPVPPTMPVITGVYYYELADIFVEANDDTIIQANITNRIGSDAPFSAGLLGTVDMAWIFSQWQSEFEEWFDNLVDQLTGVQVTNLQNQIDDLNAELDLVYLNGHNLIKNYPSLEQADGVRPEFWEYASTSDVTEEDAAGESLPDESPCDRVLKFVPSSDGGYAYQKFKLSNEKTLYPGAQVTVGAWMLSDDIGVQSDIVAYDVTNAAVIDTSSDLDTADVFKFLSLTFTIPATCLEFQINFRGQQSAIVYLANPQMNVGPHLGPYKSRGEIRKVKEGSSYVLSGIDPGGSAAGWQNLDFTSFTSENTTRVKTRLLYKNTTTDASAIHMRRYGDTQSPSFLTEANRILVKSAFYSSSFKTTLVNDGQVLQYYSSGNAADAETLYVVLAEWWEWE